MKTLTFIGLLFIGITGAQAQNNAIDKHFSNFKSEDSFTKVNMGSKAFELMAKIDCEEDELKEITEMASQITELHILVDSERPSAKGDYKSGLRKLEGDYEELMSFSDKKGEFKFFIDESAGIVRELVIFGANDSTLGIVSLSGSMDLKKVGKFTSKISEQTMEVMKKSHNVDEVLIYPNPTSKGEAIKVNLPVDMKNVQVDIYSSAGEIVKSMSKFNGGDLIDTNNLRSGQYVLRVEGNGISIKKKFVVE